MVNNAKAALITRGLAELERLVGRIGCSPKTFSGQLIGQGVPTELAIKQVRMVVEGINALPAAVKLSKQFQVELWQLMQLSMAERSQKN
ncbi:glycerol-3-phosphate dehydrogenase [Enterococcus faecium]|uniref:glycerol-3-phosphate dehydrogenase n=1 Tax=Enterococcus faecium TaxID=1352 RepID=UPI00198AA7A9|nr:glycerol-3-phosphate dehydrogenase [Enterococcus faecium]EGP5135037.1 glycerol-3-phosphate dehydrogenase [Enterococcus faecium]MDQ8270231.1 glycerol-3-phosphate dehydrogenase [Enterococcus faecium]MEB8308123.1 glycerol-3-phosphate dehydrogenase [Enterococcus faecium]NTR74711.1 glycerol-3-phosphate dehydrogenase [Enterococcus faecium]